MQIRRMNAFFLEGGKGQMAPLSRKSEWIFFHLRNVYAKLFGECAIVHESKRCTREHLGTGESVKGRVNLAQCSSHNTTMSQRTMRSERTRGCLTPGDAGWTADKRPHILFQDSLLVSLYNIQKYVKNDPLLKHTLLILFFMVKYFQRFSSIFL